MFFNNIKYFLLFLQTGLFGALFAQNYSVFNTTNSDLIDNSTTCLSKDSLGNVYVGTQWGLNSFDGSTWVDYSSELLNPSVILWKENPVSVLFDWEELVFPWILCKKPMTNLLKGFLFIAKSWIEIEGSGRSE